MAKPVSRRAFLQSAALVPIAAAIPAAVSWIVSVDAARSAADVPMVRVHFFSMTATGDGWCQTMSGFFRDLPDAQAHFHPMPGAHTVGWSQTASKLVPAPTTTG